MQEIINKLIEQGIAPAIAESLAKTMTKEANKKAKASQPRKGGKKGTKAPKEGIEVSILVETYCSTCETLVTHKKKVFIKGGQGYDSVQKIYGTYCENCIKLLEDTPKEELISLITIQNHRDLELRSLSFHKQLKLAKKEPAMHWYTLRMEHAIPTEDDENSESEENKAKMAEALKKESAKVTRLKALKKINQEK